MPKIYFTQNLKRHVTCPTSEAPGQTVREVLDAVFAVNPAARSYVLDDQGALRKHIVIFAGGQLVTDRQSLSDPVTEDMELHIMQALSGG